MNDTGQMYFELLEATEQALKTLLEAQMECAKLCEELEITALDNKKSE